MYNSSNRNSHKVPATLLSDECQLLYAEAQFYSLRNFSIIFLALNTGLRNAELCHLTIECIKTYEVITNVLTLPGKIAKGGISRDIPLNTNTREVLENFLLWKVQNNEEISPISPLFVSKFAKKILSPRDIQRIVSAVSSKAIGRSINPHILRHTFATRLLQVSNLAVVKQILGHKNIQTTQIYTHPSHDDMSKAVDLL